MKGESRRVRWGRRQGKNEKKLIEAHGLVSMLDRFSSARDSGNGAKVSGDVW